jgi:hypothetical protein
VSQTGNNNEEDLPPPLAIDIAQVMVTQTHLLEALAQGMNRPTNNHGAGMQDKMSEFMRLKPPTFVGSDNPMEADDWLKVIERKLDTMHGNGRDRVLLATHQLTRIALSWWEAYSGAVENVNTITWEEFVEQFRQYHISDGIMKLKANEFRNLKQGNKTLSEYIFQFTELFRYALELVNTDAKKQTKFIEGLTYELRTLMTPQIYPNFNTLMNRTILAYVAKTKERKENKHKFLEHKV